MGIVKCTEDDHAFAFTRVSNKFFNSQHLDFVSTMVYNEAQEVIVFLLPSKFSYGLIGLLVWVSDIVFL